MNKQPYARTRSKDKRYSLTRAIFTDKTGSVVQPYDWPTSSGETIMNDIVTPGYGRIVGSGGIVNNPASSYADYVNESAGTFRCDFTSGHWYQWSTINTISYIQTYPVLSATNVSNEPNLENIFRSVMLRAIANIDASPYALAEDYFELGKTAETLRKPIEAMKGPHDTLKRALGRFELARRGRNRSSNSLKAFIGAANAVGNAWLLTRFGYAQVFYTAFNLFDYYQSTKRARPDLFRKGRFKSNAHEEYSYSDTNRKVYKLNGTSGTVTLKTQSRVVGRVRASILYEKRPTRTTPKGLTADLGLRLKDLPKTAWQLMPASWFVDRFLDVSGGIQGLMNLYDPTLDILAGSYSHNRSGIYTTTIENIVNPSGQTYTLSGTKTIEQTHKVRNVWHPSADDLAPPVRLSSLSDVKQFTDEAAFVLGKLTNLGKAYPKLFSSFHL